MKFRLYVKNGCPFCESAKTLFKQADVPFEVIDIANDPIITAGLQTVISAFNAPVPIVISFATGEIIKGFNQPEINRAISVFKRTRSDTPSSSNTAS